MISDQQLISIFFLMILYFLLVIYFSTINLGKYIANHSFNYRDLWLFSVGMKTKSPKLKSNYSKILKNIQNQTILCTNILPKHWNKLAKLNIKT